MIDDIIDDDSDSLAKLLKADFHTDLDQVIFSINSND